MNHHNDKQNLDNSKNLQNQSREKPLPLLLRVRSLAIALLLFMVLYTLTNEYSAAVSVYAPKCINTLAIALDNEIAFIPFMIVPYSWSLLLFVASFFIVRTPQQLSLLSRRLIVATLFASLIFYLYPAHFSFARPLTTDWTALGYAFLSLTDKPFNQLPSLHVSYALLLGYSLWTVLVHKTSTKLNLAYQASLIVVCTLIIVSTVFTYQHHLLDIVGGLLLAVVVLVVVDKVHNGLVLKYLSIAIAGFLIVAIASFFMRQLTHQAWVEYIGIGIASYWLISFMRLAWIYQKSRILYNVRWFRKNSIGKLTIVTWIWFAPLLVAYRLLSGLGQFYNRHLAAEKSSKIESYRINDTLSTIATPRLAWPTFIDSTQASTQQIIIIDVTAEIDSHLSGVKRAIHHSKQPNNTKQLTTTSIVPIVHYLYLPLLDLQSFRTTDVPTLVDLFQQIDRLIALDQPKQSSQQPPITLLNFHCVMGFSRSIAVQLLYLVYCAKLTSNNYQSWLLEHYPRAHISEHYLPIEVIKAMSFLKPSDFAFNQ